ncbi:MAG: DASS family sodium-coupled anion symporter [Pyrinomonadaceae bacterium]|nr:DASS family sodium-coupled anion symporter [Pyrinomonadaceae bacterium]MCX7639241.1 DASS family sodium-coupled anion symporter [Pyrinomonadaceae bacterium]MDW8303537.1 DASS family sodium-coupled anion symporter [Acidobacteriota bacterium]
MSAVEENLEIQQALSPGEEKFDRWRKKAGFFLAPTVFLLIYFSPFNLSPEAHKLAAVISATIILWICESLPMPITALTAAALCVVLRIAPAKEVFAPFADPLMFLFIGSFIIARAIFLHKIDKRFAYSVLSLKWIDARPSRILFAFGATTAFLSAWISNTATTAMMMTLGLSIISFIFEQERKSAVKINYQYATSLMLMTSFAASIGGLMTPIGTPPNVIGIGFIRQLTGYEITFFKWLLIGIPIVLTLYIFLFSYLNFLAPAGIKKLEASRELLKSEKQKLGKWTRGQKSVIVAFLTAVFLWIFSGLVALIAGENSEIYKTVNLRLPEAVGAILGAFLLFILPGDRKGERAITWSEASKIDWGVILLYGGGFSLGVLSFQTGLAEAIGKSLTSFIPFGSELGLLIVSAFIAVLLSETTSNTASANMVVPVVIAIAQNQGINPVIPALGATFAASLGFMLPVSTPCNAIVYGSGYIPLKKMIKYGLLLDIFGTIIVILLLGIGLRFF